MKVRCEILFGSRVMSSFADVCVTKLFPVCEQHDQAMLIRKCLLFDRKV